MKWLDVFIERSSRNIARVSSRRSFLSGLGTVLVGTTAIPLLPVARAAGGGASDASGNGYPGVASQTTGNIEDPGDPTSCDYWRYCAIDGFLCSCCGGSHTSCPAGTEMSPMTWIGTCMNPVDNKHYIISYNDCCGKTSCGRCLCNKNESDKPPYRAFSNNDTNWCLGTQSSIYHCSTGIIVGVAVDKQ